MRHRYARILLLSAWLFATGGLWDLLQVVAWARMFSNEVATVSVVEAAENTFSVEKKCDMCRLVEQGKQKQDETGGSTFGLMSKAPVVFQSVSRIVVSEPKAVTAWWPEAGSALYRREAPPLPPPRVLV